MSPVEGRVLKREPRKHWAWLIPWSSGGVASIIGDKVGADRVSSLIVGLAAGVVWQLLFRRDLTSRLTFMAVLVTVGLIATLASRQEFVWDDMDTAGLYAIGILLGLIYTEHYQRWRDRAERPVSQTQESDPAAR
jgi:hypothetical protein